MKLAYKNHVIHVVKRYRYPGTQNWEIAIREKDKLEGTSIGKSGSMDEGVTRGKKYVDLIKRRFKCQR